VIASAGAVLEPAAIQSVLNLVPPVILGAGLIAIGTSLRRRHRATLTIAGGLELVVVAVNIAQIATGSPLGPGPSQLAFYLSFIAVIVAAVVLLADRSLTGRIRWALAIPAGCIIVSLASLFVLPLPWLGVLPGLGFAVAGVLLMAEREHPAL
jgi:hypothetical protein